MFCIRKILNKPLDFLVLSEGFPDAGMVRSKLRAETECWVDHPTRLIESLACGQLGGSITGRETRLLIN